jgi:UDP-N-acetylmuramate dehydrogenase
MGFGYDRSRLQGSGEVLLSARFIVTPGDPAALREIARTSLAYRKRTQPLASPSAGCIFQNPMADAAVRAEIPRSAGALVDRAGLKGAREGGAIVSPRHANFIVNDGTATAADIRRLIERCRTAVRDRFGVELLNEIVFVGEF